MACFYIFKKTFDGGWIYVGSFDRNGQKNS